MFTRSKLNPFFLGMVAVCLTLLVFAGCSKKTVIDDTPSGTAMTVTVSPTAIQTNNTAVVEATVVNGSTPLPNRVVNFTVSPAGAGYFTPATDTTDGSGIAASIFTATVSGSANISANVEGTSVTGVRSVNISDAPQAGSGNITISVSPSLLLANGADSSVVTVTIRDGQGALAPNGTVVKLTAGEKFVDIDGNGYWTNNVDSIVYDANPNGLWDAIGSIPTTATVAGGAGVATTTYVSGSSALTVYVKATVDDNGITGNAEVQLQLSPNTSVNTIYLNSDSMHLSVKATGGIETGYVNATCYDSKGNRVPQGIPVSFIITDGPGGGEHLENVGYGPYAAQTNGQGVASVALHSGTVSGTVRIRAYSDTVLSNATQVLISAGPPAYVVVGAGQGADCNVPYWNVVGAKVDIVAVVSDIYLNPVNDSEVVYFSTDEGSMKSHQERTQDLEGIANTIWISGNNVSTADGVVMVYAETAGGTVADTSYFINSYVPTNIFSLDIPSSMPADDFTKRNITVQGLDLNGNYVEDGNTIEADARILGVEGGVLSDGCFGATMRTTLTSNTLTMDESTPGGNDDGIGAVDQVTFWSPNGGTISYNVNLTTGTAYRILCELQGQATAFPTEVVALWAIIRDRYGNPLGDHTLTMSATQGTVQNPVQETNAFGEANGFIWTAPDSNTAVTITVVDSDPLGNVTLTQGVVVQDN